MIDFRKTAFGEMVVHSLGFLAIFGIFLLLYLQAYRKRAVLELTELEVCLAKFAVHAQMIHVATAMLSILIVGAGGEGRSAFAGIVYGLIGPARTMHAVLYGKRIERLHQAELKAAR